VTAEVVLRLFWSGLGAQNTWTKYKRMYGRWKMMNFFYYLRNKKKTKCYKEQKDLVFYFLSLYENEMMKKYKKTSQEDKNT